MMDERMILKSDVERVLSDYREKIRRQSWMKKQKNW